MTDNQKPAAVSPAAVAVGERLKALLDEHDHHGVRVRQMLAREDMAFARDALAARKRDTRLKIIVGGAALAEARANPEFGSLLYEMLARRVEDPRDKALIADGPRGARRARQSAGPVEFIASSHAPVRPTAADFDAMAAQLNAGKNADESS
jgi:hypothetical protein